MRIVAKQLTYIYNPKSPFAVKAVDDVSVSVEEGEFFGIIGHTGSGKSTFIQHLNGLLLCSKGMLSVGDLHLYNYKQTKKEIKREVEKIYASDKTRSKSEIKKEIVDRLHFSKKGLKKDRIAVREKVGMVFQYPEYQLFAETVKDDVAFGIKNFHKKRMKADKNLKPLTQNDIDISVQTALETVGLNYDEVKDKSPFELSGGQKRRVAIAGVIVTKPEILVLDEPVAGLDPQGKRELFELLHNLKKSVCKTIIIVSHDMDDIAENCTRVAVFNNSRLVRLARTQELFKDVSFIKDTGLDLPLSAYIAEALRVKGVDINTDFKQQDCINKLITALKERGL